MCATITNAGVGSGYDLESLIQFSLSSKKQLQQKPILERQAQIKNEVSGLGTLKSAIDKFSTALKLNVSSSDFGGNKVTIKQSVDDPIISFSALPKAAPSNYNISVTQLALGSKFITAVGAFNSSSDVVTSTDGIIKFAAGGKELNVTVSANDTLANLSDKINTAKDNFGVSAKILLDNGKPRLIIESVVSGGGNALTITTDNEDLKKFSSSGAESILSETQQAIDAIAIIDGITATSKTNVFENTIQDTSFTLIRTSEKDALDQYKSTAVKIAQDNDKIKKNITDFIKSYNLLLDDMDSLGKKPVIVGKSRVGDPGLLAGDQTLNMVKNTIMTEISNQTTSNDTLFDVGFKLDNKGRLSLDSSKLDKVLASDPKKLEIIFSGDFGVAKRVNDKLSDFISSSGSLNTRIKTLNTVNSKVGQELNDFNVNLSKYEDGLRKKYASLDKLIAGFDRTKKTMEGWSKSIQQ